MSSEAEENSNHIENVDVVNSLKENLSVSEITSDSGIDTVESYSGAYTASLDSDISPEHDLLNDVERFPSVGTIENESDSVSSPISVSPDSNDLVDNILEHKELSLIRSDITGNVDLASPGNVSDSHLNQDLVSVPDLCDKNKAENMNMQAKIQYNATDFSNVNGRDLASSTVSLNETNTSNTVSIPKPPYSRSAENISTIEHSNGMNKEMNTDKILSDFVNQKSKASAMQKIPENPQPNVDRYARIPKELLPQDLGSIVKNVHGIFSSVSGGLKYAYNNTPRISMQKAQTKPVIKPIPNGKVMNDIFEDETIEETLVIKMNEVEKSNDNLRSSPITKVDSKSEHNNIEGTDSDSDSKRDILKLQVEQLEKLLAEQSRENSSLREKVKQQLNELQEKDHSFKDLEAKLDVMGKRVDQAEREKDAAVMRYASVECAGIEARRAADKAAAAEKAAMQEVELMQSKLKTAAAEKQRICRLYDDKCHELLNSEREASKVREELRELEGRLKWTQSKLRMEMDAYKESAERVEKLTQQVSELESAKEAAVSNATDSNKAKQLETELHESQAALILCRHERDALEKKLTTTTRERDSCARERHSATAALTSATLEVEQLKIRNVQLEEEAAELAALRAQAALADALSAQLQRESERCAELEASAASARAGAETCARREAAALAHAARLTQQHVARRHGAQAARDQVQAITADNASLRERITTLEEECTKLRNALSEETDKRNKENKVLARKVAELTEELSEASKKLEWEKGENAVLKKKHASAIKELNRELHRALKRCEQLEAKLPPPEAASNRAGSVSSLSSAESAPQEELHNGHADPTTDVQVAGPSRQALIERIVSLQRAAARRSERCEFLEEHARQLTEELRSKAKLLRQLLCSLPAGAVASQHRDANKKEIARLGGGAMAAVWGGDPAGMTLELSLEMNKRLQAVLEDTLLKNITLKENMDTLGAEISRLKDQGNSSTGTK